MAEPKTGHDDVRMRGFVERLSPAEALGRLRPRVGRLEAETVSFDLALGRTLAEPVVSPVDVPAFRKSAVDGYGIRGEDSFGAQPSSPLELKLVGEVFPGRPIGRPVGPGEAVRIMTGGPIPDGVDAVAMAEHAEEAGGVVRLTEAVAPGRHVVPVGEDVGRGALVLAAGRVLRPQDLGVLASIGCLEPRVVRRPRVAIATSGNEIVAPEQAAAAGPAAVVNSNGYVLDGLVRGLGGEPVRLGIVGDDPAALKALCSGFPGDLLVTTGGTSVGLEDYLPVVVGELGQMVVHGLNIRPGSPSGFGSVDGRLVFLLPGNPVAAMVGFDVLVRPALQWLLGQEERRPNPRAVGRLTRKIASALNREDFVRVRLCGDQVEPVRAGGSGVLTSTTEADGFLIVPRDREGLDAGTEVVVYLY